MLAKSFNTSSKGGGEGDFHTRSTFSGFWTTMIEDEESNKIDDYKKSSFFSLFRRLLIDSPFSLLLVDEMSVIRLELLNFNFRFFCGRLTIGAIMNRTVM